MTSPTNSNYGGCQACSQGSERGEKVQGPAKGWWRCGIKSTKDESSPRYSPANPSYCDAKPAAKAAKEEKKCRASKRLVEVGIKDQWDIQKLAKDPKFVRDARVHVEEYGGGGGKKPTFTETPDQKELCDALENYTQKSAAKRFPFVKGTKETIELTRIGLALYCGMNIMTKVPVQMMLVQYFVLQCASAILRGQKAYRRKFQSNLKKAYIKLLVEFEMLEPADKLTSKASAKAKAPVQHKVSDITDENDSTSGGKPLCKANKKPSSSGCKSVSKTMGQVVTKPELLEGRVVTNEELLRCLGRDLDPLSKGDVETFSSFVERVGMGVGPSFAPKIYCFQCISEATYESAADNKKTMEAVLPAQEALTVLMMEDMEKPWIYEAHCKLSGLDIQQEKAKGNVPPPKFTTAKSSKMFGKWSLAGVARFAELLQIAEAGRKKSVKKALEVGAMKFLKENYRYTKDTYEEEMAARDKKKVKEEDYEQELEYFGMGLVNYKEFLEYEED